MPPLEVHLKTSIDRTGKDYKEIHQWIDDPEKKYERHDVTKILEFGRMFEEKYGKEGAEEYIRHIHDDLNKRFHKLENVDRKMLDDTLAYFGVK